MEIKLAIDALDQNLTRIDFKKYPKAVRSGLAPSDIEMCAVDEARKTVEDHLSTYQYTSLGDLVGDHQDSQRIKFNLNGGWKGIV